MSISSSCGQWIGKCVDPLYEPVTPNDMNLIKASYYINLIRAEIYNTLGYTCSAGIAHNKMFAKLGSNFNKPNG